MLFIDECLHLSGIFKYFNLFLTLDLFTFINIHGSTVGLFDFIFRYEMQMRADSNTAECEREAVSVFPVSTAAKKILKEFSLRYGVCGLHRQISALMCMAKYVDYYHS